MKKIIKRMQRKTPLFFRRLRNGSFTMVATGTAILTTPVELPGVVREVAGYLIVTGTVAGIIAQTTVIHEKK